MRSSILFTCVAIFLCEQEASCQCPTIPTSDFLGMALGLVKRTALNQTESIEPDLNLLTDNDSILGLLDTLSNNKNAVVELGLNGNTVLNFNESNISQYKAIILNSIKRSLAYYGAHLDEQNIADHAVGMAILQGVDNKFGGELQSKYPLEEWITTICSQSSCAEPEGADSTIEKNCLSLVKLLKNKNAHWTAWHSPEVLQSEAVEFSNVGHEKEVIWSHLNFECIVALNLRCEVPFVCERIMFDPVPRSQYMLTHQLLHRILAKTSECPAAQRLLDSSVDTKLCAKMFQEANLLAQHNVPEVFRDLFSEQVALCGYIGFPNFFRKEWLDIILSWQSTSDYGCFLEGPQSKQKIFISTDVPTQRKFTKIEQQLGVAKEENCLRHFTSLSLSALAMFWDYLESI